MVRLSPKCFLALYALVLCCLAPLRPLWLDEILQLSDTYHNNFHQTADRVAHNPGGVPLIYLVQNIFVNAIGHPFYAARLVSILGAVAGMAAFIWLVQLLDGDAEWPVAAALYAVLPISLRYALEVRQYGPALAFAIGATALLIRIDDRPSWARTFLYGTVLTLGLYSHPYLAFVLLAHTVWVFARPSAKYVLPACAVGVVLFLPWYVFARGYWVQAVAKNGYQPGLTWKTPLMLVRELSGGGYFVTCVLIALAVYGYRQTGISQSLKRLLLVWILLPLPLVAAANLLFRYFFAIRQLVFIIPPLCIFAAEGLRTLPKVPRTALALFFFAVLVFYDFRWFHQP